MINLEWTTDTALVESTLKDPSVYPWVSDDRCPSPENFHMPTVDGESIKAVLCYNYESYCGCFILFDKGNDTLEIHTCLLPSVKGMGKIFGDAVVSKIFKETDCKAISTYAPETNPLAKRLALKCGFVYDGIGDPLIINGKPVEVSLYILKR